MKAERGFRRVTAVASVLILILGVGAVAFNWASSMSSRRASVMNPPSEPIVYVVGSTFVNFPEKYSEAEIGLALAHLEETFQLESRGEQAVEGAAKSLTAKHPGAAVSYLYLPGALPGPHDPPPGAIVWDGQPSGAAPLIPSPGIPLVVKPDVVQAIREKYPDAYRDMSDADLAKVVAETYPELGHGRLWSRKAVLEDEARHSLPATLVEAVAKLRTNNDLSPTAGIGRPPVSTCSCLRRSSARRLRLGFSFS